MEDDPKSLNTIRMEQLTGRLKRLEPEIKLMLRNQHAIMTVLGEILQAPGVYSGRVWPLLKFQLEQTDEALRNNRVRDD